MSGRSPAIASSRAERATEAAGAPTGPVLLCTGTYFRGGISSWAIRFVRLARRAGVDVRLTLPWPETRDYMDRGSFTLLDRAADLEAAGGVVRLPVPRWTQLSTRRERQRALAAALEPHARGATVVLNYDWDLFGATALLAARGTPMRVVNVVHSDDEFYYAIARHYAPMFTGVVGVSSTVSAELRRRGLVGPSSEIPEAPVRVIPCGVEIPPAEPRTPRVDGLRIVTACRIDERQKRASDIPRVAAALRDRGVAFEWTVLGDGPERERTEHTLRASGLTDRVHMLGWRAHDEVLAAFRGADVYVQTSAFEGTPVSVMEAMAYGVVPVVTEVSGTEELLGTGADRVGFSAGVGDAGGLAEAVASLSRDPDRLAALSAGAEARVRTVLSIERTTAEFLEFLEALPDRAALWLADRDTRIRAKEVGEREARLDRLPNPLAVVARKLIRLGR